MSTDISTVVCTVVEAKGTSCSNHISANVWFHSSTACSSGISSDIEAHIIPYSGTTCSSNIIANAHISFNSGTNRSSHTSANF